MAKKALTEDEGNTVLQKQISELEEANTQLEASNAEMDLTISRSSEVVIVLCCVMRYMHRSKTMSTCRLGIIASSMSVMKHRA
jgi:hypothetical protein